MKKIKIVLLLGGRIEMTERISAGNVFLRIYNFQQFKKKKRRLILK